MLRTSSGPIVEFQQSLCCCEQDVEWRPLLKQAAWRRREDKWREEPLVHGKYQALKEMEEESESMSYLLQLRRHIWASFFS